MRIWKRNAVVATIVLFVCVALYLSWQYGQTPADDLDVFDPSALSDPAAQPGQNPGAADAGTDAILDVDADDFFDQARLSRLKARESALAILTDAVSRTEASQEVRDNAAAQIEVLAKNAMTEATIENLIIAKGFKKCVVFIDQSGVKIVVAEPVGGMTSADAAKIKDIVLSESTLTVDDIRITHVAV